MALVVWPDAAANAYVDSTYADAYFADAIHSAKWTGTDKDKALVSATRLLDRRSWDGEKTAADQPLAFPRTGLSDKDGAAVADDALHVDLKSAVCEYALALIINSDLVTYQDSSGMIKGYRAGDVSVDYAAAALAVRKGRLPLVVMQLVGLWLAPRAQGYVYGTDVESSFDDADSYGLTGGFK